jgi:hypothetical protein
VSFRQPGRVAAYAPFVALIILVAVAGWSEALVVAYLAQSKPGTDPKRSNIVACCAVETPADLLNLLHEELWDEEDFSEECKNEFASSFETTTTDLNSDGKPEFVMHGSGKCLCSPTGNCLLWIWQKESDGYSLILRTRGVELFEVKTSLTNGFCDLVTKGHVSATEKDMRVWKFDGTRYKLAECMEERYDYWDSRGLHIRKRPRITRKAC